MLKEICSTELCTGCMLCLNVCPYNSITIDIDEKGFYIPKIESTCIECNHCRNNCPQLNKNDIYNSNISVYASWNKERLIRHKSTSGGVFHSLATKIIENHGYVCGVAYNDEFMPYHLLVDNMADIHKLMGSKYVQSKVGSIYQQIKNKLSEDKYVLFSGTPCQNAALKLFLHDNYDKLILVDIVCHGTPSPMIFNRYKKHLENIYNSKIKNINFRYNKNSWTFFHIKINFSNNQTYSQSVNRDPFLIGFLNDFFCKESCHNCKYTRSERVSDITIADFWGYISERKEYRNTEEGISLVLINSSKGEKLFNETSNDLVTTKKSIKEAKAGNRCLTSPFKPNQKYNDFWDKYINLDDNEQYSLFSQYFVPKKVPFKRKLSLFINDHTYIVPHYIQKYIFQIKPKIKKVLNWKSYE